MPSLDELENRLAKPGYLSRRSALGKISRGCAALIGAIVGGIGLNDVAYAANVVCCNLAYPNNLCNSNIGYCPCSNPNQWQWTCTYNGCSWVCGECYNCNCSYVYRLCSRGCACLPDAPSVESIALLNLPHRAVGEACH